MESPQAKLFVDNLYQDVYMHWDEKINHGAFMTQLRGADNTLARRTLDWAPHYSSWRQGFAAELTHATRS